MKKAILCLVFLVCFGIPLYCYGAACTCTIWGSPQAPCRDADNEGEPGGTEDCGLDPCKNPKGGHWECGRKRQICSQAATSENGMRIDTLPFHRTYPDQSARCNAPVCCCETCWGGGTWCPAPDPHDPDEWCCKEYGYADQGGGALHSVSTDYWVHTLPLGGGCSGASKALPENNASCNYEYARWEDFGCVRGSWHYVCDDDPPCDCNPAAPLCARCPVGTPKCEPET